MNRSEAAANLPDFPPVEEEQQPLLANTEDVLDLAFRQTIQIMKANITRVRLGPLSQTIQGHAQKLKKMKERTTEAENRIAAPEHTSEMAEMRVQVLERQIQSMAVHIDDLENRGRKKNIKVIGLPEDTEGSKPTKFFKSWILKLPGLDTKPNASKSSAPHPSSKAKTEPATMTHPNQVSQFL